ncbi:hypothetical protein HII31_03387 [Pseudocercospora fuligena]|uniref:MAPEG family protein n=1 Tax=Pseudocercospora fuligena TaxID=685502 RepID=A0A8H6RMQ2_9PEZI|nr:hypothetical protein HII31_03387 [Pseudocercospora fuligena]
MATQLGLRLPLVKPVVALASWTFIMETWMYATRIPAISKYNVNVNDPSQCSQDMQTKIPQSIKNIADNFNHLHEQPQVFYAVALSLTLLGDNHPYTEYAAWGYVGVRVVHSLFQSLVNKVMTRFQLFATSSLVLAGLTGRAAQLAF